MMMAAFLTTAITASITAITMAIGAVAARSVPASPPVREVPTVYPPGTPRQVQRHARITRSVGSVPPEYLPALARSRLLRLRIVRPR